ncbi:RNA polymerase sigma factor [Ramlibacter tataouinensis]|uniref:RNA polymerase sigma factor n=1 Tax=Ramlibacter tataouinensis TaxID=94132 RepID=UPI0022F40283|nr:RNA polymerase sigma factor [Ramlibacter tataouinensis]WBY02808.1 RNA polymerase sigma factor [Ramlibacter tataouinensis]
MEIAPTEEASDDGLLAGLRQGQARAFEQLMRRYNRRLFRVARGIVRDDAEAQDAVQEGYLHAFQSIHGFRGESSIATWLTRIVINHALTQQRRAGRLVLWSEEHEEGAMPHEHDQPGRSAEDEFARRELRERLQQAVDLLPPIYRSVFILRAVEGMSVEETARSLSVSGDVVKTRLLRARAMLRDALSPAGESEARHLYDFQGHRCDEAVAVVLARLRSQGVIRDH